MIINSPRDICVYTCIELSTCTVRLIDQLTPIIMCAQLLKPVYIRGRDLPVSVSKTTNFEISEAISESIKDLKCVQQDRDLWRIYIGSLDSRKKLLTVGFDLNNINVRTFEINPYSAGTTKPEESVLKITVQGIPLSVDDGEILKMLKNYGCEPTSDIKLEKIRHPVTRKMTSILNGKPVYICETTSGRQIFAAYFYLCRA